MQTAARIRCTDVIADTRVRWFFLDKRLGNLLVTCAAVDRLRYGVWDGSGLRDKDRLTERAGGRQSRPLSERLGCSRAVGLPSGCTPVGGPRRHRLRGRPRLLEDVHDRDLRNRGNQQAAQQRRPGTDVTGVWHYGVGP